MRNHERREHFAEALLFGVTILAYEALLFGVTILAYEALVRGSVNWVFMIGSPLIYAVVKLSVGRVKHIVL